jgi:hypothetical protein
MTDCIIPFIIIFIIINNLIIMEDLISNAIEKLIIKKYPVITNVDSVEDLLKDFKDDKPYLLGKHYVVNLNTIECLDSTMMMKINKEIRQLFFMFSIGISLDDRSSVRTFFNCGDGKGFIFISDWDLFG